jgi:hypothetical protein
MVGCVFYKSGEVKYFNQDTAIQPGNQVPISHDQLSAAHYNSELEIMEILPPDFEQKLRKAIQQSVTISGRERKRILNIIDSPS